MSEMEKEDQIYLQEIADRLKKMQENYATDGQTSKECQLFSLIVKMILELSSWEKQKQVVELETEIELK